MGIVVSVEWRREELFRIGSAWVDESVINVVSEQNGRSGVVVGAGIGGEGPELVRGEGVGPGVVILDLNLDGFGGAAGACCWR